MNKLFRISVPLERLERVIQIMTLLFESGPVNTEQMYSPRGRELWCVEYDEKSLRRKSKRDEEAIVRFWCDKTDEPVVREALKRKYLYAKAF